MLSTSGAQAQRLGLRLDRRALEARQGVGTRDWGSPDTTLKQTANQVPIHNAEVRGWGSTLAHSIESTELG